MKRNEYFQIVIFLFSHLLFNLIFSYSQCSIERSIKVLSSCLEILNINKEMFAIDFQLIHDLLSLCRHIKTFRVNSVSMSNYNEEKFIQLFNEKNHLHNLETLNKWQSIWLLLIFNLISV